MLAPGDDDDTVFAAGDALAHPDPRPRLVPDLLHDLARLADEAAHLPARNRVVDEQGRTKICSLNIHSFSTHILPLI